MQAWWLVVASGLLIACRKEPENDAGLVADAAAPSSSASVATTTPGQASASASAVPATPPVARAPLVREEATVVVDGVGETWRLVWREPPAAVCNNLTDQKAVGAPCSCWPFGFAQAGVLDLVRVRPTTVAWRGGVEREERLRLNQFLSEAFTPAQDAGVAPLWVTRSQKDVSDTRDTVPIAEIEKKPLVKLMTFADYDHDGEATEFVMTFPSYGAACGHYSEAIVLGVSKARPYLHKFDVALRSESDWEAVRKAKAGEPVKVVDLACGDHGNTEGEQSRIVTWDAKGLHVQEKTTPCASN